jgi:Transmembrane domain of unknown function (DUF3566)
MAVVRRIGPGSAFKVGLVLYACIGLVLGVFVAAFSGLIGSLGTAIPGAAAPGMRFGFGMGIGAIIVLPIFYGIIGGIIAAVMALIYNAVAGMVGGLEVDIS